MEPSIPEERSQLIAVLERIDNMMEAKFRKYLGLVKENDTMGESVASPELVTLIGLCKEIGCSKPTMTKWLKDKRYDWLFNRSNKKVGKRKLYDVADVKKSFKEYGRLFGSKWCN